MHTLVGQTEQANAFKNLLKMLTLKLFAKLEKGKTEPYYNHSHKCIASSCIGYILFPVTKTMYICLVRCTAILCGKENF
jgi:hypothetical protein